MPVIPSTELASPWWRDIFEPWPVQRNESGTGNSTGDVFCANCINDPDKIACGRAVFVAFLALVTAGVAIGRVLSLNTRGSLSPAKLALYYLLVIHLIAGSLEWIFGWTTQFSLVISYAKAVELLIICYFYVDLAVKMMQWNSSAGRSLCLVSLFMMFIYFTLFCVMGGVLSIEPWTDCHAPYWIWFSLGQLVTVQLMVTSFMIILHRINRIAATPAIRRNQKTRLLCLLYVYEASAFADVAYHVSMFVLADEHHSCSSIFHHDQLKYSLVKLPYDILSFLLPVWAILFVFRPTRKPRNNERAELYSEEDEDVEPGSNIIVVRNWRRRYRPLNASRYDRSRGERQEDRGFVDGPRQIRRSRRSGSVSGIDRSRGLRHVSSAPTIIPPSSLTRRGSVSRSMISSPLYPIPEEPPIYTHSYQDRTYLDDRFNGIDNPGMVEGSLDNVSVQGLVNGEQ